MLISFLHRRKILLALYFFSLIHFSNAQQRDIETLKEQLTHAHSSADSITELSSLCKTYFPLDKKESAYYGRKALDIAERVKLQNENVAALSYLTASALRFSNQSVEAIHYLDESLQQGVCTTHHILQDSTQAWQENFYTWP